MHLHTHDQAMWAIEFVLKFPVPFHTSQCTLDIGRLQLTFESFIVVS